MSRLFPIARDALAEDQRRFHDAVRAIRRRPISGPFIVTMNSSPDLAARFAHLGHYFHARGQADESIVSIRARSYISLIGSRALDAPYEWGAWVNWALDAGVPQATVDAIRVGATPASLTPEEALAGELCVSLYQATTVSVTRLSTQRCSTSDRRGFIRCYTIIIAAKSRRCGGRTPAFRRPHCAHPRLHRPCFSDTAAYA